MSDARTTIFERLADEIRRRKTPNRPFVLDVTGIDCAGKTEFTVGLDAFLQENRHVTQVIRLDDFHNPRAVRRAGDLPDEHYYERIKRGYVFNFDRLVDELLRPMRAGDPFNRRLRSVSWRDDRLVYETDYTVTRETIVLLEGLYPFLPIVSPHLDYTVFLDITMEECRNRATARDPADLFRSYEQKYIPAFRQYLAEHLPEASADLIIDNTDWRQPRIK